MSPAKSKATKTQRAKPAARKPRAAPAAAEPTWAPEPAADTPQRDYLVIFDEPDEDGLPQDDSLVIDLEAPRAPSLGELDVEQKLDLKLTNRTNRVGTFGFILSILGALSGAILMVAFWYTYPADWHDGQRVTDSAFVKSFVLFTILSLILLIVGTILTHYGRRIQAHGNLSSVRIVEKGRQNRAFFESP